MKRHLQYWGAAYFLIFLALIFNGVHAHYEVQHEVKDAQQHGQPYMSADGRDAWIRTTSENMQSELWQIGLFQAVFLLAMKHQWFRADAEDIEKLQDTMDEIKQKLEDEIRYWKWVTGGKQPPT